MSPVTNTQGETVNVLHKHIQDTNQVNKHLSQSNICNFILQ